MASRQDVAESVVKEVYGGSLYGQGRGFYVALELLAIVWGSRRTNAGQALVPAEADIQFHRRGHDFARRLLFDSKLIADEGAAINGDLVEILADLYRSLLVPVPFKRSVANWGGYHLYPYVGQLIHYDSVNRGSSGSGPGDPHVERYLYRGGGALAYDMLRRDPDPQRRSRVEAGLLAISEETSTALGRLTALVASHDAHKPTDPTVDRTVAADGHEQRETGWSDLLRTGTAQILGTDEPVAKRVEYLMHWVPYCLARHQLELAHRELGRHPEAIVVDVAGIAGLRRESRRGFDRHRRFIADALRRRAELRSADEGRDADTYRLLLTGSQTWSRGVGDFYSATMAVVGAVNHNTGPRYYTLKLPLLETIVAATIDSVEGLPFADFCHDVLFRQLGLVVDTRSGSAAGVGPSINHADLEHNEAALMSLLDALGVMTSLSDATRFVGGRVR